MTFEPNPLSSCTMNSVRLSSRMRNINDSNFFLDDENIRKDKLLLSPYTQYIRVTCTVLT